MKAIIDALNVVYDEKEKRSFVRLNLLSLMFTLIAIFSLMVALAAVVIAPIVFSAVGLSSFPSLAVAVLRWPLLLALVTVALAAMYRYGPSRTEPRWQWLSVGSLGRSRWVADHLGALLLVHRPFRRIQRDLRVARRRCRHDDVDVDLRHRHPAWRRTQRRDRASNRQGFRRWAQKSRSASAAR